jgi:hypothetical protein
MRRLRALCGLVPLLGALFVLTGCGGDEEKPAEQALSLHPANPHYLLFRGEPTALVTSGEHYGAVVNADFDYARYLDELERRGFNLTRLFSGSYIGQQADIVLGYDDPLVPRPGRAVSPWAEVGGRYDLTKWNPDYFERLRRFMEEAGRRGIVVEMTLFSAIYTDAAWGASPFNPAMNVNGAGPAGPKPLYELENGGALEHQDAFVRKLVGELRSFDNLYYEVINEPWEGPAVATDDWQDHMIETIEDAESGDGPRHLIARNYRHGTGPVRDPHPSVSIFNFHYQRDATPYLDLDGVISFDETGFQGTADGPYVKDAWFFMLGGGGIYSNLDWSFAPGKEDGSFDYPAETPGGGGAALRRSLAELKRFLDRFDLPRMRPAENLVRSAPAQAETRAMEDLANAYAVYVDGGEGGRLVLDVAAGRYRGEWVDPRTGAVKRRLLLDHPGGEATLRMPPYEEDIALALEAE